MSDPHDPTAPGHAGEPPPDADGASDACDWDISDRDNLQAAWLEFQRERQASCPVTGTPFDLALEHDPAEGDGSEAEVLLSCDRCGRQVAFEPPDAREVFGWAE